MTSDAKATIPLTMEELATIESSARLALADDATTFAAPVALVLRLVRSHKAASVDAYLGEVTGSDLAADLSEHIEALRNALHAIAAAPDATSTAARRARQIALVALDESRAADDALVLEFGNTVSEMACYESPEYGELPEPCSSDVWEDGLGRRCRVVEVDDAAGMVRVEEVEAWPEWLDIGEFATYLRRVEPPAPDRYVGGPRHDDDGDGTGMAPP